MDDNSIIDDDDNNNESDFYESMSIKDLRRLLVRRGFDSLSVDQDHLVAAARRLDQTDFDDQARRIFQQLNLEPSFGGSLRKPERHLEASRQQRRLRHGIRWQCGSRVAASDRKTLDHHHICAVVNCQSNHSENVFENEVKFKYHRFVVSTLAARVSIQHRSNGGRGGTRTTASPLLGGFQEAFDFIEYHVDKGNSVLIHCLAGAHRAGTLGTAWIMYKTGVGVKEALALARKCRPIIGPFGLLLEVLYHLESEFKTKPQSTCRRGI